MFRIFREVGQISILIIIGGGGGTTFFFRKIGDNCLLCDVLVEAGKWIRKKQPYTRKSIIQTH